MRDPNLLTGQMVVKTEKGNGFKVRVFRVFHDGIREVERKEISSDTYLVKDGLLIIVTGKPTGATK